MKKRDSLGSLLARRRWAGPGAESGRELARENGKLGGRPKKLVPCPRGCGVSGGVAEMRAHRCGTGEGQ